MKSPDQIPYYSPDGVSLGFRSIEAATRLVAGGFVKPAYGRKGHLKAIWSLQKDGGNPVTARSQTGTRYSFLQNLDTGQRCWRLRKLDGRDDDGNLVSTRGVFLQVVTDCLAPCMRDRRQIGARHIARARGAFSGGTALPVKPVGQPASPERDGATQAATARTGGLSGLLPGRFRDLSGEAAAAGRNIAQFA